MLCQGRLGLRVLLRLLPSEHVPWRPSCLGTVLLAHMGEGYVAVVQHNIGGGRSGKGGGDWGAVL